IEWPQRIKAPHITLVPGNTADIYLTLLDLIGIDATNQPVLDGVSLVSVIDGLSDSRPKPMGFWKFDQGGISTPSDKWMREELAAQQAGRDYHDKTRLMADAAEIKTQYPRDQHPGHAAWLDWPWKLHHIVSKKQPKEVTLELYNLEEDPMETENVVELHAGRVRTMRRELHAWQGSVIDSLNGKDY
ncbi:MAG: N-acetylgalactosamine 6-sulfate sulfatase, partial [Planctomycetes bacterium]|nr:N-acetylgalactosamine 6-sulfate sulfatase [Planctomycetota bacterium]